MPRSFPNQIVVYTFLTQSRHRCCSQRVIGEISLHSRYSHHRFDHGIEFIMTQRDSRKPNILTIVFLQWLQVRSIIQRSLRASLNRSFDNSYNTSLRQSTLAYALQLLGHNFLSFNPPWFFLLTPSG